MSPNRLSLLLLCLLSACGSPGNESSTSSSAASSEAGIQSSVEASVSSAPQSQASESSASSEVSAPASASTQVSTPIELPWALGASNEFSPVVIENGISLYDRQGNALHAHGAGMIKVGEVYYWYGENRYEADQSFKSVRLYKSNNLKDWDFVNDILTDQSDPDLNFAKIERPKIIHNPNTGQYIMWMHKEGGDNYGQARAAVAVSDSIDGDYRYLGSFRPLGHMSRDCTAFVDDDGAAYFLSAANENADLHLYRLSDDFTEIASLETQIWVGQHREAPALTKYNGQYYLLTSGTSGWDPNQAKYGTAPSILGPWSSTSNIGNGTTFDSQPTFILTLDGSTTTSYLYLGDRWLDPEYKDSKYVWLPLEFSANGTPQLNWSTRIAVDVSTGELYGSGVEEIQLRSKYSGKCLDVADESIDQHANILQWSCSDRFNQRWRLSDVGDGYVQIKALHSSQCIDVASGSSEDGANILQWPCIGTENQMWQRIAHDDGTVSFQSKVSGKCLDVEEWDSSDGGNIQQWECLARDNQKWIELQ